MTTIDGLLTKPRGAKAHFAMAHGAGAGMRHAFLEEISERLAAHRVATFRYEFRYMAQGRRRPDPPRLLQERVREAVGSARQKAGGLPLFAGGKSMGGRMTSLAFADSPLDGVGGLVFLGFPLHAPGRVGAKRADHLDAVPVPMLFIQGTRDSLADLDHIERVTSRLGARARLHVVDGGDHSFKVLKKLGRDPSEVMEDIAVTIATWMDGVLR